MNIERLRELRHFLAEHPEQHDQTTFGRENECGTVACVAGWANLLFDDQVRARYDEIKVRWSPDRLELEGVVYAETGRSAATHAQNLLGIDVHQGTTLFFGASERDGALAMIDKLIETEGRATEDELYAAAGIEE